MPNRILRDSIRTSESLSKLTAEEERHFYRLLVYADDYGRFDARPEVILGACYPLLLGNISPADVSKWTQALATDNIGILELYSEGGRAYGAFRQWEKYQRIRNATSRFPAPPLIDSGCEQLTTVDSGCEQLTTIVADGRPNGVVVENGNEVGDGDGDGLMADEPPTAAEPPSFESPKNFQQWEELLKREANKVAVLTRAAFMLTTGEVPPPEAYGRMGNIAKAANNDHGFVLTKIWDCAKMKPAGDFLSYVQRALKPARAGPNRSRASPPETNTDYLSEYQQRRGHLPWEQRNGNDDHTGTDRG